MQKIIIPILILLVCILCLSNKCNNVNTSNNNERELLIGIWCEKDTSVGSECWAFRDSSATHSFYGLDTTGTYPRWHIKDDTIMLNEGLYNYDKMKYVLTNNNILHLDYYRWDSLFSKDFYKE
jgi:hypothetical protein